MSSQTRQAKAELLQAFRLETDKRIATIKGMKVTETPAIIMKQGIILGIREARNLLSELAGKE